MQESMMSASRLGAHAGQSAAFSSPGSHQSSARPPLDAGSNLGSASFRGGQPWSRSPVGSVGRISNQDSQAAPTGFRSAATEAKMEVVLSKSNGAGEYGFVVVPDQDTTTLVVTWVDETGLLASWNRAHPLTPLKEGDIVEAVNGVSGDAQAMRAELLNGEVVRMMVSPANGCNAGKVSLA